MKIFDISNNQSENTLVIYYEKVCYVKYLAFKYKFYYLPHTDNVNPLHFANSGPNHGGPV